MQLYWAPSFLLLKVRWPDLRHDEQATHHPSRVGSVNYKIGEVADRLTKPFVETQKLWYIHWSLSRPRHLLAPRRPHRANLQLMMTILQV